MSALSAFECVGRLNSFSKAAEELSSSQPAVSRHIAALEDSLDIKLFNRNRGRVALTLDGQRLYHSVVSGLDDISTAIHGIKVQPQTISIACSHSISHLWLMPRYDRLQEDLGDDVEIITITSEYDYHPRLHEEGIDMTLTFDETNTRGLDATVLFDEEIFPVCSPTFAAQNAELLTIKGEAAIAELPLLDLRQRNYGWATWESWFSGSGLRFTDNDGRRRFGNYVYMLEAACNGLGVALGWTELVDDYLAQERLVTLPGDRLQTGGRFYLLVNTASRNRGLAERAVESLRTP